MTELAAPVESSAPSAPAPPGVRRRGLPRLNPVLGHELRVRLRRGRSWAVLSAHLVLLGAICLLVYEAESSGGIGADPWMASMGDPTRFASVGRAIFDWLVLAMLLLVLFLVPGLTAGAIAGERERQTLVPLQVSLLRPRQIVVGKLGASVAYLALLVVATAPLLAIAYLVGGVTIGTVLKGIAVVLFTGLVVAALSLCASALCRRVQTATVASYAVVLLLLVGTLLVHVGAEVVDRSRGTDRANAPAWLLAPNPLFTVADVLDDGELALVRIDTPLRYLGEHLRRVELGDLFGGVVVVEEAPAGGGGAGAGRRVVTVDRNGIPIEVDRRPFWVTSVACLSLLGMAGLVVAGRRLRTPARAER